ncbi:MAG TPA: M56 family metallopeptidase [Thermoanaerobaculia bacterium]|nr:M56 family metallopeptidase [Thermoanaerobaculia bacterium]
MTPLLADLASWWLQSGLLLGAALLVPAAVRLRDPAARLRIAQAALLAAFALPFVQPPRPADGAGGASIRTAFSLVVPVEPGATAGAPSLETAVLAALSAGALLRLGWLGAGLLSLRALRRRARPLAPVPASVVSAEERTGACAELLVSSEVASPVAIGWRRPAVILPERFAALGASEQEAVACHELLHVKRRDSRAVLLEELARALLWSQPAAWGLLSGISLAREQAIDGDVVRSTGDRRSYLRALARLAAFAQEAPSGALPFHTRSHLLRRVAHLAKEVPMSRRSLVLATTAAAALLLLVGAAGAAVVPFGSSAGDPGAEPAASSAASPSDAVREGVAGGVWGGAAGGVAEGTGDDVILKVGGDVKEPVEIQRVQPTYPEEARKNRVQGRVVVRAVIDEKGVVTKVEAVESSDPMLTESALDAVKKWTYKPATKKGKPVKVFLTVTVSFKLS